MKTTKFNLESTKSNIDWIGRKVTGAHNGTINVKEGELLFNDGTLFGGQIIIDTTSITILDVTDPDTNVQFAGHLASDDFFSIEKFPTATFEITAVKSLTNGLYHITGDLTVKGITHAAEFEAKVTNNNDTATLVGKLMIDRTKYGIKFRSGNFFKDLGDTLIYNEFQLDFNITALAATATLKN